VNSSSLPGSSNFSFQDTLSSLHGFPCGPNSHAFASLPLPNDLSLVNFSFPTALPQLPAYPPISDVDFGNAWTANDLSLDSILGYQNLDSQFPIFWDSSSAPTDLNVAPTLSTSGDAPGANTYVHDTALNPTSEAPIQEPYTPISVETMPTNNPGAPQTPPSSKTQSPMDDFRVKKRTLNTLAARRYRQKRVDQVASLENALRESEKEKDALKTRVARLEGEVEILRALVGRKA